MKRQAIVVGINRYPFLKNYKGETLHLQAPYHDATSIADLLDRPQENPELAWSVTRLLSNKETSSVVSADQLQDAIRELFQPKTQKPPEVALLFFAGHGLRRDSDGKVFLAHSNAKPRTDEWGFPLDELRQLMEKSPIPHQIVFLDCCHSGDLVCGVSGLTPKETQQWQLLGGSRLIVAACREDRSARGVGKRGILTEALLQGLNPANQSAGQWVTTYSLYDYLDRQIGNNPLLREQIPLLYPPAKPIKFWLGTQQDTSLPTSTPQWWKSLCQQRLEQQRALSSRFLTGVAPLVDEVYVPLGLVERKRESRRGEGDEPDAARGSGLYQETEITRRFQHGEFLEQVLRRGDSPKSQGRRLVVLGEPGAGKTTLLQQAASWVAAEIEEAVALWVSLADLQGRSLEDYLLEVWLRDAVRSAGKASVTETDKNDFVGQFHQGRVWLFLDGADEMAASSGNPLVEIEGQIRNSGLLGKARILLTCRLNLWDGGANPLGEFDVYRTLEFDYPTQVERFITNWFASLGRTNAGAVARGEQLRAALKEPGKERIQDLVKNPLRLTLLCFTWHKRDGKLPDTQAGLYQKFVERFYEWKENQFPLTSDEQERLNAALGELAREAIDKEPTRFRLRQKFVSKFLGSRKDKRSPFDLALKVGWLNQVGVNADNPDEPVYAFYHASFQEYFAALAVADWDYFLPRNHVNFPLAGKEYRIFEPQWKQVILLWLGRGDVADEEKEKFIEKLVNFDDGCGEWSFEEVDRGLYEYRAFFLAATVVAELKNCNFFKETLAQIIQYSFGYLKTDKKETNHKKFLSPIFSVSRNVLLAEIDKKNAIASLEQILDGSDIDFRIQWLAADALREIAPSNKKVIFFSEKHLSSLDSNTVVALILEEATSVNDHTISTLLSQLTDPNFHTWREVTSSLMEVALGNDQVLDALEQLVNDSKIQQKVFEIAKKLMPDDYQVIQGLFRIIQNMNNEDNYRGYADNSEEINPENNQDEMEAIHVLKTNNNKDTRKDATDSLKKTLTTPEQYAGVVSALKDCLSDDVYQNNFDRFDECYKVVWDCATNLPYPDFYRAWHDLTETQTSPLVQTLNLAQLLQAQPTKTNLPHTLQLLCIDIEALTDETDTDEIAQTLCNKIYRAAFPSNSEIPPEVGNASQLVRALTALKQRLQKPNLALILQNCNPTPELVKFCRKLTDVVQIGWITSEPLQPPLRGFLPSQPNLKSAIQNWLEEIG